MANNATTAMTTTQKIIAIAVVIIIISTVALPVIDSMQEGKTETGHNTPLFRLGQIADSEEHILSFAGGVATYDGNNVATFTSSLGAHILAVSDSFVVFHRSSSNDMRVYADTGDTGFAAVASITFENGTATWVTSGNTQTKTYSWLYVPDQNGTYGSYNSGDDIKFNADAVLLGMVYNVDVTNPDLTPSSVRYTSIVARGTYNNMQSVFLHTANEAITTSDCTVTLAASSHSGGYYSYEYGTTTATIAVENNVGDYYVTGSFFFLIAPVDYTYTVELDNADLFGVVAILLILVPVMMAVRMISLKRN